MIGGVLDDAISYGLPPISNPHSVTFSPDGQFLAVVNLGVSGSIGNVIIFSVQNGALSDPTAYYLPTGSFNPNAGVFSPDGSYFVTANGSGDITLFQVSNGVLGKGASYALPFGTSAPVSVAFSSLGTYVVAASPASSKITLVSMSGGILSEGISYALPSVSSYPLSVAFSPNAPIFVTANAGSSDITSFNTTSACLTIPPPATSSTTGGSNNNGFECDTGCMVGIFGGGAAVALVAVASPFLIKKYCCQVSEEQQSLING